MDPSSSLPNFLQVSQKPKHTIKDRTGENILLEPSSPKDLVYVYNCKSCHCDIEKKVMKVIVDGCKDCAFNIESNLLSGMLEFIKCEDVAVNLIGDVKIWTTTVDGSTNFKMNAENSKQFESIYTHHCSNVQVSIDRGEPITYPADVHADPDRQYIIHWEEENGTKSLVCEKVVRDGIYPTTEKALAETVAKEKEMSEKMARMMVDSIKITKKPPKSSAM